MKYRDVIGIVGGMGSYATLDFFKRLLDAFPAEKEWDRPRIIIDNRCTMPSRVRAILYDEEVDYVVECLSDSVRNLIGAGANILVLACNTSHVFLDAIIENVPESKGMFVNIIDSLGETLQKCGAASYRLLGSEGTLDSGVYQKYLNNYNVSIEIPQEEDYPKMRDIIEDVKQGLICDDTSIKLLELIMSSEIKDVIIGCTEFPPVYRMITSELEKEGYRIYDPLETTIKKIKKRIG